MRDIVDEMIEDVERNRRDLARQLRLVERDKRMLERDGRRREYLNHSLPIWALLVGTTFIVAGLAATMAVFEWMHQ